MDIFPYTKLFRNMKFYSYWSLEPLRDVGVIVKGLVPKQSTECVNAEALENEAGHVVIDEIGFLNIHFTVGKPYYY